MREDIKAYIDGELPAERAEQVRRAIEADPELGAEYEAMKAMTSSIAAMVRQPQVKGADKALEAARPRARRRWLEMLVVTGLFAVVAAFTIPMFTMLPAMEDARTMAPETVDESAGRERTGDLEWNAKSGAAADSVDNGVLSEEAEITPREAPAAAAGMDPDRLNMTQEPREMDSVRSGEVSLEVADVKGAIEDASELAESLGGKVESTVITDTQKDKGELVIHVPVLRLDEALEKLSALGKITARHEKSEDLSVQLKDATDKSVSLEAELRELRAALTKAKSNQEADQIREKIERLEEDLEASKAKKAEFKRRVSSAILKLTFIEKPQ